MQHEYREIQRDDGLKRLVAGNDLPHLGVRRGDLGGLVCDSSQISSDSWVRYGSDACRSNVRSGALVYDSTIASSTIRGGVVISSSVHDSHMQGTLCEGALVTSSRIWQTQLAPVRTGRNDQEHLSTLVSYQSKRLTEEIADHFIPHSPSMYERSDPKRREYDLHVEDSFLNFSNVRGQSRIYRSWVFDGKICDSIISDSYVKWTEIRNRQVNSSYLKRLQPSHRIRFLRHRVNDPTNQNSDASTNNDVRPAFCSRLVARVRRMAVALRISWLRLPGWSRVALTLSAIAAYLGGVLTLPSVFGYLPPIVLLSGIAWILVSVIRQKLDTRLGHRLTNRRVQDILVWLFSIGLVLGPIAIFFAVRAGSEAEYAAEADTREDFDPDGSPIEGAILTTIPVPIYVTSSNLSAVAYDLQNSYLYIWFRNGTLYRYDGVGELVYRQLLSASSKGSYHASNIRGRYAYVQLN